MNKIIFGGICMLISIIGITTIISGIFTFGWQVGYLGMPFLLERLRLTYLYDVFYWLGIIGFILGIWGIFEKNKPGGLKDNESI
jgi:hypothetical protein